MTPGHVGLLVPRAPPRQTRGGERELRSGRGALSSPGPRPPSCGCCAGLKVSQVRHSGLGSHPRLVCAPVGGRGKWPPALQPRGDLCGRAPRSRAAAGRDRCYSNAPANGPLGLPAAGRLVASAAKGDSLTLPPPPSVSWAKQLGPRFPRAWCLAWALAAWFISTSHHYPILGPELFESLKQTS